MRAAPGPSGPSAPRQGVHPQDPPHQVNLLRAHGVSRPVPIPNRTAGERRSGPRASRSGQSASGIAACSQAGNRTVRPSSHMRGVDRERSKMWAERASCWAPRRSGAAAAINTHGVSPTGTARSSAAVTIRLGSGAGCRGGVCEASATVQVTRWLAGTIAAAMIEPTRSAASTRCASAQAVRLRAESGAIRPGCWHDSGTGKHPVGWIASPSPVATSSRTRWAKVDRSVMVAAPCSGHTAER